MLISTQKRTKTHSQRGHTSLLGRNWQNTLTYSRTDMSGTADEASNSQIKHSILTNKRRGRDGFNSYSYNSTTCWMTRKEKKGCFCILTTALWVVIVVYIHFTYQQICSHDTAALDGVLWAPAFVVWLFETRRNWHSAVKQIVQYSFVKWHCWSLEFLFKIKALTVIIYLH